MGLLRWRKSEEERRDELLSAYLDGELKEGEREQLEARLSQDPALRAELRTLHQVSSMVRELPRVSAPRNFILSEAMVRGRQPAPAPEPRRAWTAPLLTAATAVVSLLFAVVLTGGLLLPGVADFAAAPEPVHPMEEAAPLVVDEGPAPEAERDLEVAPTPYPEVAVESLPEEPELEIESLPDPTVAPTVVAESILTPTIPAEEPAVPETELGVVEPTPVELDVTPPPVSEEDPLESAAYFGLWQRVTEIVLGLATLVLTIATVQAWRTRRG